MLEIETYHKVLTSGYRADQSKLPIAERIVNLLAMFCIIGWRIFWMTMLNRCTRHLKSTGVHPIGGPLLIGLFPKLSNESRANVHR